MKPMSMKLDVEVDRESLDKAVAEIENAFPNIIFSGEVGVVHVNYTQNNFSSKE